MLYRSTETGKRVVLQKGIENKVVLKKSTVDAINDAKAQGKRLVAIHNHPNGWPPSFADSVTALSVGIDLGVVCGHNGNVYTFNATPLYYNATQKEMITNNARKIASAGKTQEEVAEMWTEYLNNYGCNIVWRR